ncbi:MAG: arginine--tRNA ligase [Burkholderia sp.]|nr:arginine--tRNA ligase [Burkholderia sp.]
MLPVHKQILENLIIKIVRRIYYRIKGDDASFIPLTIKLEHPKVAAHGDISCNIAMQLSKILNIGSRELAENIIESLIKEQETKDLISTAEIAGVGFINIYLSNLAKQSVIRLVLEQGFEFGLSKYKHSRRILLEFVSANPTGPLHVGHARQAALGDVLANVLTSQGYYVHREFYYNDAGTQIRNLALSAQARARGLKPEDTDWPESAYKGEYISDIANDYMNSKTITMSNGMVFKGIGDIENLDAIRTFAVAYLRREQDIDLQAIGVKFDQYYLESSLYIEGRVEKTVNALIASGMTYEQDGALWLRTTNEGDDKDRVIRKSDGSYTYFIPDIAYHMTKWERNFTKAINIQGSDHHGTISRVRAGLQFLNIGIPKGYPDYILHKMVTVICNGQEIKISKRAGNYVSVRDLIEWSSGTIPNSKGSSSEKIEKKSIIRGRDAVRFFLISRKADTEFVFNINLALKQSDENPVYYVQYAYARITSILNEWKSHYIGDIAQLQSADLSPLTSRNACILMQKISEYPEVLEHAANELSPHIIVFYLRSLASQFHSFYNSERVLVDDNLQRTCRVALLAATRQVLENSLEILGVSAPEKM